MDTPNVRKTTSFGYFNPNNTNNNAPQRQTIAIVPNPNNIINKRTPSHVPSNNNLNKTTYVVRESTPNAQAPLFRESTTPTYARESLFPSNSVT
jgi:hypothetical protein